MQVGIDLGGTKIEGAVLDEQGHIIQRTRIATPKADYLATLNAIAGLLSQLETAMPAVKDVRVIGVATPGSTSSVTGKMKNCNSTCLNHQSLQNDLEKLLNKQVRIANDADCFTLSEAIDGAAQGMPSVFGVILGTGVGGGICINRQLIQGPNSIVGEWGHNPISFTDPFAGNRDKLYSTRTCYCGKHNCIESFLSGPGFEQSYFQLTGERISASRIVQRSLAGDPKAMQVVDVYQDLLARMLSTVINLLDPFVIVLGGGMSNIASLYKEVPERWSRYVFSDIVATKLVPAKFGDSSGVRGAAWLSVCNIYE